MTTQHSEAKIRFAHLSDVHLGCWNAHPELREFPQRAFEIAVNHIIEENLDFVIITGDFFDTSVPPIDVIKFAVVNLKRLSQKNIPVYAIAGSHDYSPTGKTMLNVLEAAGLLTNVNLKMTEDPKTGTKIFGVEGWKGGLEKALYEEINKNEIENSLSNSDGFKIMMFHSEIDELKSIPMMDAIPLKLIPKGFDYYATGHIHEVREHFVDGHGTIALPGPIFPADFHELEKLSCGGFYIVETENQKPKLSHIKIELCKTHLIDIDANGKSSKQVENDIIGEMEKTNLTNTILLIKIKGTLSGGQPSDINFKSIGSIASSRGAISTKRSVHLESKELQDISVESSNIGIEELEDMIINQYLGKVKLHADERNAIKSLLSILSDEKHEGENVSSFEERINENVKKLLAV